MSDGLELGVSKGELCTVMCVSWEGATSFGPLIFDRQSLSQNVRSYPE
jgi:hypothetical protein